MLFQLFLLIIPIAHTNCHTAKNSSDVIMVGEHADLNDSIFFITTQASFRATTTPSSDSDYEYKRNDDATTQASFRVTTTPSSDSEDEYMRNDDAMKKKKDEEKGNDDAVFVPTDKFILQNDELIHEETLRMKDVLDVNRQRNEETEKPGEVLFIQGRNSERNSDDDRRYDNGNRDDEFKYIGEEEVETTTVKPLDCVHLDCDNKVIESVCGRKIENGEVKFRLFKNECFFRKVNCGLNLESNRYQEVAEDLCKMVGVYTRSEPHEPFYYSPSILQGRQSQDGQKRFAGRRFASRRTMAMDFGGSYCGHSCPEVCTDQYEPECALSASGEKRVFLNHCHLDLNSCQFEMVWRRLPLADCTGGKKADLHYNRAFVDLMQRAGLVDNKGRLNLHD